MFRTKSSANGLFVSAWALAAAAAVVVLVWPPSETGLAMYQRAQAPNDACQAAAAAISALTKNSSLTFVDNCIMPNVTRVTSEPGFVVVTRITEWKTGADDGVRLTYSVMLDGRSIEGWRTVGVKAAPNHLVLDISMLIKSPFY